MKFLKALPQYPWKNDVERGIYLLFIDVYGGKVRYYPKESASVDLVKRDVETLYRRHADPLTYGAMALQASAGWFGTDFQ